MLTFLIFGLLIGSFSNVIIHRLPIKINNLNKKEINLFVPRSHCPNCEKTIPWIDLIPILSWVLLKGKCRFCKTKISMRYPIVELVHGLSWLMISFNHDPIDALIWSMVISIIINLAIIDRLSYLLPNVLIYPFALSGIVVSATRTQLITVEQAVAGAIFGYLLLFTIGKYFEKLKEKVVLGGGDVKYVGALGAWFGPINLPYILIIASGLAIIVVLIEKIIKKQSMNEIKNKYVPFGVYLSVAGFILYIYYYGFIARNFFYEH
jgi:leader peptidase (prepilin peptidase)/N-methyltransferase